MFIVKQVPYDVQESDIRETMRNMYTECAIYGNHRLRAYNEKLITDNVECAEYEKRERIAEILTDSTGKKYECLEIRGSVQGEWNVLYYPVDSINDTDMRIIETEYFNTGSEWEISDGNDRYYLYIHDYEPSDEMICKYVDCEPSEIEIHRFTGYVSIPQWD